MKYFLVFLGLCLLFFRLPRLSSAHGPGMLPFVQVDGLYTNFNPTYQAGISLHSAQDMAVGRYLPKNPIEFSVDRGRLPFPSPLSRQFLFRWSIFAGDNFDKQIGTAVMGQQIHYAFPHTGSYLVMLEAGVAGSSLYSIDTVLVNVFPSGSYFYPQSLITIKTGQNQVLFNTNISLDPSAKIVSTVWDLGTGEILKGQSIQTSVQLLNNFPKTGVTARVIDDHGFITDVLLRQETFTRQIIYDTVVYSKGKAVSQFGTVAKSAQETTEASAREKTILGITEIAFATNVLIIFLSIIGLIGVRILISFYGSQRKMLQ